MRAGIAAAERYANEAAVELFRRGALSFTEIARVCERALTQHEFNPTPDLEDLLAAGEDIDYVGATNVELVGAGEAAGTYREYTVTDGDYAQVV